MKRRLDILLLCLQYMRIAIGSPFSNTQQNDNPQPVISSQQLLSEQTFMAPRARHREDD